jgi:hypothetical protein
MSLPDSVNTSEIDSHECELEQVGPDKGPDTKYFCQICGTTVRPAQGVKNAKRNRLW